MDAWLGETPAALTSMVTSPREVALPMSPTMDSREARSTVSGRASKPASVMVCAMSAA